LSNNRLTLQNGSQHHDREGVMKDEWQSMAIEDLFALHEQMVNVLKAKLFARNTELERRLLMLGRQPKLLGTVKSSPLGLSMAVEVSLHCYGAGEARRHKRGRTESDRLVAAGPRGD